MRPTWHRLRYRSTTATYCFAVSSVSMYAALGPFYKVTFYNSFSLEYCSIHFDLFKPVLQLTSQQGTMQVVCTLKLPPRTALPNERQASWCRFTATLGQCNKTLKKEGPVFSASWFVRAASCCPSVATRQSECEALQDSRAFRRC